MKVRIVGDSNTAALKLAHDGMVKRGEWPQPFACEFGAAIGPHWVRNAFFEADANGLRVTLPAFEDIIGFKCLEAGKPPDAIYGLCFNYHTTRVWRDRQWSTFAPLGLQQGEFPVSPNVLKRIVLDDQPHILKFALALAKLGVKVFAIEAPYPFAAHKAMVKQGVRPDVVRAVDRFYRSIIRAELDRAAIATLAVPPDCIGSDGFMKTDYKHPRALDQHHANARFGELMLRQMIPFLQQNFESSRRLAFGSPDPVEA